MTKAKEKEMTLEEKFMTGFDKSDSCWNWKAGKDGRGYGSIYHRGIRIKAHRFLWEKTHGPIPKGNVYRDSICVLHKCDNRSCVRPDHLFLGSFLDNHKDMISKGRAIHNGLKGYKNGMSKLSNKQVREIRSRFKKENISQSKLGKQYGISQTTIGQIIRNERWIHL